MLDGKYEITSEQELGEQVTVFGATAPDGTALTIYWYDLETTADEHAFERYRALLRQLRRGGHAAVYDLVSRPGAHYVAWRLPEGAAPVAAGTDLKSEFNAVETVLQSYGRTLSEAYIRAAPDAPPQVYALGFAATPVTSATLGAVLGTTSSTTSGNTGAATGRAVTVPAARSKNRWGAAWTAFRPWTPACVLGLLGIFFLLLSLQRLVASELVSVPAVQGQEVNVALKRLHDAGFRAAPVALTSARPAGEVLEVRPETGTPLRPGRTLSVRYALPAGHAPETAPDVIGDTLARAEARLDEAGFRVGDVARSYSRAPSGTVIGQLPAPAAPAAQGGRFALLVSDGPLGTQTFLPDLTGLSLGDALGLAEAAGFARGVVRLERTPGNGTPAGTVLAQNIAPYVSVPLGEAQLRLTLAAASAAVTGESGTPDLTGLDLGSAQRQARALGLSIVVAAQVSAPELPRGVVMQRPEPGAPLEGTVRVTLNRAPLELPIPRVVASTEPAVAPAATPEPAPVRRARYVWQLGQDAGGRAATVTVIKADGSQETVVRAQTVAANERLEGIYLTTTPGPLVFTLTLDGEPYGAPLAVP